MRLRAFPVLLLLLALGAVAAQVPPLPPPGPFAAGVEVTPEAEEVTVTVEEASLVRVTVRNTQQPTGTPADTTRQVGLAVTGKPEGWTVEIEPASLSLAPGQQEAVTVRIQVSSGAAPQADLVLVARLYGSSVSSVPAAGSAVQPEATDSAPIAARRVEALDRRVLESLDGPWIFVVLLALLAAVLVAGQLLVRNRQRAVALRSRASSGIVAPGGRVALPIQVQNLGRLQDALLLKVAPMPAGWAAFLPVAELPLAPGRSEDLDLVVIAPPDAPPGLRHEVVVTAVGSQNPRRPASLTLEVTVAEAAQPVRRRR